MSKLKEMGLFLINKMDGYGEFIFLCGIILLVMFLSTLHAAGLIKDEDDDEIY